MSGFKAAAVAALVSTALAVSAGASAQGAGTMGARIDALDQQAAAAQAQLQMAQGYGSRPPADVGDDQEDAAGLEVRIGKLEAQMRQITGQIEQMQFAQRKLEDGLKKFQQDVEFRFQEAGRGGRPQKRTELSEPFNPAPDTAMTGSATPPSTTTPTRSGRRSDAFDPSADPNAPGAPRTLGSPASASSGLRTANAGDGIATPQIPNGPIIQDDNNNSDAPFELNGGRLRNNAAPPVVSPIPSRPAPTAGPATTPGGTVIASVPETPKEEYDVALGYFKDKQYESAEKGFSGFLQKNPRNRLASDALYYLGETYFQRGRPADAAQQFLKISTDYSTSSRAPEAYLRLGQSLHALGAKEQACAAFSEVGRKYPNAAASIKSTADREAKRNQC